MACQKETFVQLQGTLTCTRTFLTDSFLGFAGVSYGQFIAVRSEFNLSAYGQNRW